MKLLGEIFRNSGVGTNGKTIYREAVRGVIIRNNALLMVYSQKNGDYKFPGGGVDEGETHAQALAREIREECGAEILSVHDGIGKITEYDIPVEKNADVFKMDSFYYLCEADPVFGKQSLDPYEAKLGFIPVWTDIDKAVCANRMLIKLDKFPRWTPREIFALEYIRREFGL